MGGRRADGTRRITSPADSSTTRAASDLRPCRFAAARGVAGPGLDSSGASRDISVVAVSRPFRLAAQRDDGQQLFSKAQSSMEYLLITGFVLTILVVIVVIAYSQTSSFSSEVTSAQLQKVGNQIVDAANAVYYAGPPTKKTIQLYFPELINSVSMHNQTLSFFAQGNGGVYEYAVYAQPNLTGSLRPYAGLHTITIIAQNGVVNVTDG